MTHFPVLGCKSVPEIPPCHEDVRSRVRRVVPEINLFPFASIPIVQRREMRLDRAGQNLQGNSGIIRGTNILGMQVNIIDCRNRIRFQRMVQVPNMRNPYGVPIPVIINTPGKLTIIACRRILHKRFHRRTLPILLRSHSYLGHRQDGHGGIVPESLATVPHSQRKKISRIPRRRPVGLHQLLLQLPCGIALAIPEIPGIGKISKGQRIIMPGIRRNLNIQRSTAAVRVHIEINRRRVAQYGHCFLRRITAYQHRLMIGIRLGSHTLDRIKPVPVISMTDGSPDRLLFPLRLMQEIEMPLE